MKYLCLAYYDEKKFETLSEAIEVASKHPAARLNEQLGWGVEIRPIEMCQVAVEKVGRRQPETR